MKNKFNQLCVWPGTIVGQDQIEKFNKFMKKEFKIRVKYVEEVVLKTGRNDLLFYIHDDDVMKFAVPRFEYGIRWWEDVYFNNQQKEYPKEFIKKYPKTW